MTEGVPSEERIIEQAEIIELLRARGVDDPEVKELVIKWTAQQEVLVTAEGTAKAQITFEINRAELYVACGDIGGALQCLEDARLQAHQEGETELYAQIVLKMDEVEGV